MIDYPFWYISLFIFGGTVNLTISMVMFYLRSRGGTETYTKSQLWALTLLAWVFLLNFVIAICEVAAKVLVNAGQFEGTYPFSALWFDISSLTGFLLLAFGLVYPRPFTKWSRLRMLIMGIMASGVIAIAVDLSYQHAFIQQFVSVTLLGSVMIFAVFPPVFIWLSEYSRQPSKEGRMMYTLLIWGFLFAVVSRLIEGGVYALTRNIPLGIELALNLFLGLLALVRLGTALWGHRKIWSTPENLHIGLLLLCCVIGIPAGVIGAGSTGGTVNVGTPDTLFWAFMSLTFGWMVVRPILFSYGLLRYRLLGNQVKAETAIAILGGVLSSTGVCLAVINLAHGEGDPTMIGGVVLLGIFLFYPFWKVTQGLATRLLPMSVGAEGVSMRERRNTYLMGLQTGVVRGTIADPGDRDALEEMRKALDITEREHDLLMESITQHEARLVPTREVEEAFLTMHDGRLIAHCSPAQDKAAAESGRKAVDRDVVAGMLTAITEFVGEAMKRGEGEKGSMGAISYGDSNLVIERDGALVLAIVIKGADDLDLRQAMRDTLADLNDHFGKRLKAGWDGDMTGLEDTGRVVRDLVGRLGTARA
jgi:hypothetical protein